MLAIKQLSKQFGTKKVLSQIDFSVQPGRIVGLLGKNGAGKTTIFHSILNFIQYQGQIVWDDHQLTEWDYDRIGYLPEERSLMTKLTVAQQVIYLANLKGMRTKVVKKILPDWLTALQVKGGAADKIASLSKGNQQKIQLICTLIHQPDLIILDEPFSGLDPLNTALLRNIILREKKRGAMILFSDHNMNNVENICDDIVLINQGQVRLKGEMTQIREQYGSTRIIVETPLKAAVLKSLPHVRSVTPIRNRYRLIIEDEKYGPEIFAAVSGGQYIKAFDQQPPTLTDIFKQEVGQ